MRKLTERQTQVYQFIRNHIETEGCPPTRAEIAKAMGFRSINAAEDHLRALARKGVIILRQGISRGIILPELGLPLIDKIHPGKSLMEEENIVDYIQVKSSLFNENTDFFVKVRDAHLKEIGIIQGDLLAIQKTDQFENGQLVLFRHQDQLGVRRYYKEGDNVKLVAESPEVAPLEFNSALPNPNVHIEGLGLGILRRDLN